jgi:hypothetical protein
MPINTKDRHVMAAAVTSAAEVIVTQNVKDFPQNLLEPYGIRSQSADDFLTNLFYDNPDAMIDVVVKQAVELIVANKIGDATGAAITTIQDFIKVAVYSEVMTADPQLASRWDENIDNAAWLVKRIGKFFLKYDRAYNSYKHGLRVMTGQHQLSIGLQNPDGTIRGPMHVVQASEDSVTYLQKEPIREVDGEKEIPISEVTKTFNPFEASFYLTKMSQMLDTIKATRLKALKGGGPVESINTFFELDKDEVRKLEKHYEWKREPARADEARAYSQIIAQMRANAEQQTDNTNSTSMER